jgi:hypothetical protein
MLHKAGLHLMDSQLLLLVRTQLHTWLLLGVVVVALDLHSGALAVALGLEVT